MARCESRIILTASGFLLLRRYEATVDCARKKVGIIISQCSCGWKRTRRRHRLYITYKHTLKHCTSSSYTRPWEDLNITSQWAKQSAEQLPLVQRENPSHSNTINHHDITVCLALPHNHRISRRQTSGLMVMEGQKDTPGGRREEMCASWRRVEEGGGGWRRASAAEGKARAHGHVGDLGAREKQMTQRDEIKKNIMRPTQP